MVWIFSNDSNCCVMLTDGSQWKTRKFNTAFLKPFITDDGRHELVFKLEIYGGADISKEASKMLIGVADADKFDAKLCGKNGLGRLNYSRSMYSR